MRTMTVSPGRKELKLFLVRNGTPVDRFVADSWDGRSPEPLRHALERWTPVDAMAVRFAHGGDRDAPAIVDEELLAEIANLIPAAPEQLPRSLAAAEVLLCLRPSVPVVACFDTAFYVSIPEASRVCGLPHDGLACQYVMRRIGQLVHNDEVNTKALCVFMGDTVSVTAVHGTRSIDTSAEFTAREHTLVTQSGNDIHEMLAARRRGDRHAARAVEVYVHHLRREIAAVATSLERLDMVVFTGYAAVRHPELVAEVAHGLDVLRVRVTGRLVTGTGDRLVSPLAALPRVFVIADREELELARQARAMVAPHIRAR